MTKGRPIGLVGCGNWGRNILRDLVTLGCEVHAVARSAESRQRAAAGAAASIVPAIDGLPEVDGIIVATPTITHAAIVEESLLRGVPVFCEKPLTCDPQTAAALAAAAPDRLFVMDKWRYHPGVEMLAKIAKTGELGTVQGLKTTRIGWGNPHDDVDVIWHLAPHDLAIVLEILGRLPKASHAKADMSGGRASGVVGVLGDDPWVVVEVSSRSPQNRREVRLFCEDGVAVLEDSYSERIQVVRGDDASPPDLETRPVSSEMPLLKELKAFVAFLEGGPPPRSSVADGAAIVQTLAELRGLAGLGTL
jgi:predicted dehydrogenase